jgi:AcrR family transcriptional regulator
MSPAEPQRRGPGRRPGAADTRGEILAAARAEFAAKGYDSTSVRAIARHAGVDPALVHHYFGTKEKVFVAAMALPFDPAERLPQVLDGDPAQLGERLVRTFLGIWAEPDFRAPMLGMLRSAFTGEQGAKLLREFVGSALLGRIVQAIGPIDPLRVQTAVAQMVGVAILRYVVRLEPLASADPEEIVALVAPTVQRALLG